MPGEEYRGVLEVIGIKHELGSCFVDSSLAST
jgi:hypothetical protein